MSNDQRYPHFFLTRFTETTAFRNKANGPRRPFVPEQNRIRHAQELRRQLGEVSQDLASYVAAQRAAGMEDGLGIQVAFESFPDVDLAFESLDRASGLRLLNVRHENDRTMATVFVPDGQLITLEALIKDYLAFKKDKRGRPRDNARLLNAIQEIRTASLRALWTDDAEVFPADGEGLWWEVWLLPGEDSEVTVQRFSMLARAQELRVGSGRVDFPERVVILVFGTKEQMSRSILTLNSIAELRRAKATADFFDSLPPSQQPAWVDDLLSRCTFKGEDVANVPRICILDTGINNGHPLIARALAETDLHTVEPAWGKEDSDGHGTPMAGLALFGNISEALDSGESQEVLHRLESVKILPADGANGLDSRHHGFLTSEAVARPEISAPYRQRVFALAVTALDNRDRGRPTSWSSTIDKLAVDAANQGASARLFVLAGGNIADPNSWANFPHSNSTDSIHDPGQAWNALTVGAFTNLVNITEPNTEGYLPIAGEGDLSPFSTTSQAWQQQSPVKPDVVFEGGNAAKDSISAVSMASLSLLSTHHKPAERLFDTLNATSAATALGSRMAAQIMATYPTLWPETVRGLIVHSAEWTDAMRRMFLNDRPTKAKYLHMVRHCGFGVPNIDRALWSVSNSLTMVVQEQFTPFKKEGSAAAVREMQFHTLPWPLQELQSLGETQVEMRVTLSYFIEPNPSERGYASRYRYESHGFRFEVKRATETEAAFRSRINVAAREEEEGRPSTGADHDWLIGKNARHRGSMHSDVWRGTAVDLASRGLLAVYPTMGWWKTRAKLERFDSSARYALLVSITTPPTDVDLRAVVENLVSTEIEIDTTRGAS